MLPFLLAIPWLVVTLGVALRLRRRLHIRDYPPRSDDPPFVSIIVPARNEAHNIGVCLATILASSYTNREIIVVDDGSTDGTGDVARATAAGAPNTTVVSTKPLPDGWVGKPWACWTGFEHARGNLLLFTDADTRHGTELLSHAVSALQQSEAALVSVLPRQLMESFWEAVVLPHIFVAIVLPFSDLDRINRSRDPRRVIANGQFILIRRDVYESIDGHRGLRGEVVEDLRLAQRVVEAGHRIFLAHAFDLMETRMYQSLREIVEGWSKNLARGARLALPPGWGTPLLWAGAATHLLFWTAPPIALAMSFLVPSAEPMRVWAAITTGTALMFWSGVHLFWRTRVALAVFFPLGAAVASFLMVRSAMGGDRVKWRGRTYELTRN